MNKKRCERMQFLLRDLNDTEKLAKALRAVLPAVRRELPSLIIGLTGELGAGKTTLLRLAFGELVTSPTFVLLKVYSLSDLTVYHWDLYRLDGTPDELMEQLEELGFNEYLEDEEGITFIEWFDKIRDAKQLDTVPVIELSLEHGTAESERIVSLSARRIPRTLISTLEVRLRDGLKGRE